MCHQQPSNQIAEGVVCVDRGGILGWALAMGRKSRRRFVIEWKDTDCKSDKRFVATKIQYTILPIVCASGVESG